MGGLISQILANLLFSSPNYVIFAVGATSSASSDGDVIQRFHSCYCRDSLR